MDGYGYTYRGSYTTYNSGAVPRGSADGWSKTSYDSDHKCQPVYIDSSGRRNPVKSYITPNGNTEYYVTKTEVVEVPTYVAEYKQSTPIRVDMATDYGNVERKPITRPLNPDKWRKSSSPVWYHGEEKGNRPSSPVRCHGEEKWNRPSSPVRYHVEEKWTKPSSPVRYRVEEKWIDRPSSLSPVRHHTDEKWINRPSSPVHERPQQVEDFLTKVQTQASRPNKFGPLSATYWRQTPTGTTETGSGSWTKPTNGGSNNLSQPTSDIGTAMEYLKEAVKPPPSRYGYPNTIDSREAERRYGGATVGPQPMGSYGRTIDSREAARKYGGTAV